MASVVTTSHGDRRYHQLCWPIWRLLALVPGVLVGCVFVYAGLGKAVEGGSGVVGVFRYHGIPPSWHGPLVAVLVSIEVSLGLLLLLRQWPRVVEVVVFVVLPAFTAELL